MLRVPSPKTMKSPINGAFDNSKVQTTLENVHFKTVKLLNSVSHARSIRYITLAVASRGKFLAETCQAVSLTLDTLDIVSYVRRLQ